MREEKELREKLEELKKKGRQVESVMNTYLYGPQSTLVHYIENADELKPLRIEINCLKYVLGEKEL